MHLHGTSRINEKGHLEIGGCDTVELAHRFKTPLYVMDEELIRRQARSYVESFRKSRFAFQVAYACKAFCTVAMCRLAHEEGLSLDVVSAGEIYTALKAGFPPEKMHFHGNNKTPEEIELALQAGIGSFVIDNFTEIALLQQMAKEAGKKVKALLRVTPGVEAHTHEYIQTGQSDSKFGFNLVGGQAERALAQVLEQENLEWIGLHCHIGSQIFEVDGFVAAIERVMEMAETVRQKFSRTPQVLNLGGVFGIRYNDGDHPLPIPRYVEAITAAVERECERRQLPRPEIWIEPGRSIVGEAGTTLYTVGSMKVIPGVRNYIAVDGGMSDNLRPSLYHARYEAMVANKANQAPEVLYSVAGKCCESGDMLIWDIQLPRVEVGDILAVSCTGAYNYSMASNYNRLSRPAVVFVQNGQADIVVRRESLEDLVRLDVLPERMRSKSVTSR